MDISDGHATSDNPDGRISMEGSDRQTPPDVSDKDFSVVAIVGPTACGKSALAEDLAVALGGEIVSADSMQIYRGMDIGTAKTPLSDRRVAYHCIDLVDPGQPYSVALFQRDARAAINDILTRGKVPIVCGGTGLYVRAALDGMEFPAGEQESPRRAELMAYAAQEGPEALYDRLVSLDPASAAIIHPNNVRRVVRALELFDEGCSYAQQHAGMSNLSAWCSTRYIGLTMERGLLISRIDSRIDEMLAAGLIDEIRGLIAAGFTSGLTAPQAIGYKEYVPLLLAGLNEGDPAFLEATEQVKIATHRYAKHQRTWFRKDDRIVWVDSGNASPDSLLRDVLAMLE